MIHKEMNLDGIEITNGIAKVNGTAKLTEGLIVKIIQAKNYAAQNYAGKGPKGYKRSDDRIKEDVCECLERSSQVDASEIEVEVKDACVTLTGKVESRQAKRNAEMLIENLRGVDDVINELKVEKSKDHDTEIDSYPSSANKGSDSLYASGKTGEKINSKFDSNTSKRKESADYSSTRM